MKYILALIVLSAISMSAEAYNKGSIYAEGGKLFNESDAFHFGVGASYADKWQLGYTITSKGDTDEGKHEKIKIITIDRLFKPTWFNGSLFCLTGAAKVEADFINDNKFFHFGAGLNLLNGKLYYQRLINVGGRDVSIDMITYRVDL